MSVLTSGYGATPVPLVVSQGYAPAFTLRETFTVPAPDGAEAQRSGGSTSSGKGPYLGSAEAQIAFGLSFASWLAAGEVLSSLTATVWADPLAGHGGIGTATNVTSTLLQVARAMSTMAVVVLHSAQAQTGYVVTCTVITSAGRTLECRMPRIWCPV